MTLKEAIKEIRKKYEDNSIFTVEDVSTLNIDVIPTGSLSIDLATGIGGIPRGRITEIYGAESSGKTTIALSIVLKAQEMGLVCAYIDTEQSFDFEYAEKLGIDVTKLWIAQPDTHEEALGIIEDLIRSEEVGLIVLDSLVGAPAQKVLDDDLEAANVANSAMLNDKFCRRNMAVLRKTNTALIIINQVRDKIGAFIPMIQTPGGHAIRHNASIRIEMKKKEDIKEGKDNIIGATFQSAFKKNKVGIPYKIATFDLIFGEGIDKISDLLTNAVNCGIIQQRGAYYVYNGESIAQGKEGTCKLLKSDPKLYSSVEKDLRESFRR